MNFSQSTITIFIVIVVMVLSISDVESKQVCGPEMVSCGTRTLTTTDANGVTTTKTFECWEFDPWVCHEVPDDPPKPKPAPAGNGGS